MGYGYGTGFVKASSDIPIHTLVTFGSINAGGYVNLKKIGTSVNYNVPSTKTGLVALIRAATLSTGDASKVVFGYADDASGTNFVGLARLVEMGISSSPSEVYWVFKIPAGKYVGFKNTDTVNATGNLRIFVVLFEV
jgi:hypothetical protein